MKEEPAGLAAQPQADDPQPPALRRKARKSRSKGLRSKKGCSTCRARHMKCDEGQPSCGGCLKGGRECRYGEFEKTEHQHESRSHALDTIGEILQDDVPQNMSHKRLRRDSDPRAHESPEITLSGIFRDPRAAIGSMYDSSGPSVLSPRSDSSAGSRNLSAATSRWFGLLASDVSTANHAYANPLLSTRQQSQSGPPSASPTFSTSTYPTEAPHPQVALAEAPSGLNHSTAGQLQLNNPAHVSHAESFLLRHYLNNVSNWLDLFDPYRHFSIFVPRLAVHDPGLMKAILALSARDLTIKPSERSPNFQPDRNMSVEYYHGTLQYLQSAMKDEAYLRSDELLSTILMISTYELIDGAGTAWERHLKGAFGVQRSLECHGESGGFKQAVWWSWLRQDLWAAYLERRRIYSYFVPTKPYTALNEWELAERSVYLTCQCINFASEEEINSGKLHPDLRMQWAEQLERELDDWFRFLPAPYHPLPCPEKSPGSLFRPIYIHPQAFGAAIQLHHFGHILLQTTRPSVGGFKEIMDRESRLNTATEVICGIAMTTYDDAASIMSSGCTFVAGLNTKHPEKRRAIIEILGEHKQRTGFPIIDFRDALHEQWAQDKT